MLSLGSQFFLTSPFTAASFRLPKLQAVTLQHSRIRDMSGLKSLPRLETVYVTGEQAEALEELFAGTKTEIRITEN